MPFNFDARIARLRQLRAGFRQELQTFERLDFPAPHRGAFGTELGYILRALDTAITVLELARDGKGPLFGASEKNGRKQYGRNG